MTDATATILAALIGFVGGLVVAAYTFQQKADELFLAGLQLVRWVSCRMGRAIAKPIKYLTNTPNFALGFPRRVLWSGRFILGSYRVLRT